MREKDKVWYACYGSNLCAERFSYYIKGGPCPFNNKIYDGCRDKTMWTESKVTKFPGDLYFANVSGSWGGKGVAFYDPDANGSVIMRLYKVTREQLHDIQDQEGNSSGWYGRLVPLGEESDGCPIYTITSIEKRPHNSPSEKYLNVIRDALISECGIDDTAADRYLDAAVHRG